MSDDVKLSKLRLRERCGVHTEAHPTDPALEVVVTAGQVFEGPASRAERWPEKFELLPDTVPPSADLHVQGKGGQPVPKAKQAVKAPPAATPTADAAPTRPAPTGGVAKPDKLSTEKAAVLGTVEAMTVDELRKLAAEEAIEVPAKAKTRDEVLKVVKAGLGL